MLHTGSSIPIWGAAARLLPANSWRSARMKARPTTWAPTRMICARYLACGDTLLSQPPRAPVPSPVTSPPALLSLVPAPRGPALSLPGSCRTVPRPSPLSPGSVPPEPASPHLPAPCALPGPGPASPSAPRGPVPPPPGPSQPGPPPTRALSPSPGAVPPPPGRLLPPRALSPRPDPTASPVPSHHVPAAASAPGGHGVRERRSRRPPRRRRGGAERPPASALGGHSAPWRPHRPGGPTGGWRGCAAHAHRAGEAQAAAYPR